jgi:hypothetical protein
MRTSSFATAVSLIAVFLFCAACGANSNPSGGSGSDVPLIADASNLDPDRVQVEFMVIPACNITPGYYDFRASWTPADFSIYRVDQVGSGIIGNCGDVVNGTIACSGIPASPDGQLHLSFVHRYEDISEVTYEVSVPAPNCLAPSNSGDVDNFGNFGWRIRNVGCFQDGTIEFEVLTSITNPNFVGACHTATACSGPYNDYHCTVEPSHPEVVYCTGGRPATDEFLRMCIRANTSEGYNCQDFPDFIDDVRDCEVIAPLAPEVTLQSPVQPLPPTTTTCSTYSGDSKACSGAGCFYWVNSTCSEKPDSCSALPDLKSCEGAPGGGCKWNEVVCYTP